MKSIRLVLTAGALVPFGVSQGTTPPTNGAVVYRLDSSIVAPATQGGTHTALGEIQSSGVSFKLPGISAFHLRHETGHAIGFSHVNGPQPSLMASASFF